MTLKIGMVGVYSHYSEVKIVGIGDSQITLEDRNGGRKKFYRELVEKHFKPMELPQEKTFALHLTEEQMKALQHAVHKDFQRESQDSYLLGFSGKAESLAKLYSTITIALEGDK